MKSWILACLLAFVLDAGLLSAEESQSDSEGGGKFQVSISGKRVEISCPEGKKKIMFKENSDALTTTDQLELTNFLDENNGMYKCEESESGGKSTPAYLYLKAYVCENCIEVSIPIVAGILIGDCMVTLGVAFIIYFGCRKQTGPLREGGMSNGARAKGKQEKPPPVPNPDYEVLKKGQRDLYDGLGTRTRLK